MLRGPSGVDQQRGYGSLGRLSRATKKVEIRETSSFDEEKPPPPPVEKPEALLRPPERPRTRSRSPMWTPEGPPFADILRQKQQQQRQQQQQQHPQTIVVEYYPPPVFGPRPTETMCSGCRQHIRTSTDSEPGPLAYILGSLLCIAG